MKERLFYIIILMSWAFSAGLYLGRHRDTQNITLGIFLAHVIAITIYLFYKGFKGWCVKE